MTARRQDPARAERNTPPPRRSRRPGAVTPVGPARPLVVLAVCCSALFMVGLDNTIVFVGLPVIGRSLHTTVSGLQWTVAGYTIALASLLMFSGAAADRYGRRTIFQVGLSLFTLGSWLCSLAPTLAWLVAFRLLQGMGGAMLNPAALGIITNTFTTPAERARTIGVWDGVLGLSMALGPVLGGILVGSVGWRGIFWANIPVGMAAIALTALLVPDTRAERGRRPDPVGQVLVIVMLGSLAFAIIQAPSYGWLSSPIMCTFLLSGVMLRELLRYEHRRKDPLIDFRFFSSLPFSAANLTAVCAISATAGFLFLTTLYLQDVRGFTALRAGLTMLPMPIMMAVCSPLSGRIVASRGPRMPLCIAGTAMAISTAALSQLTATSTLVFLIIAFALFGIGAGAVNSPITNGVMSGVPKSQAGVASGMNSSSRQLGQSLGIAIVGSVLAASLHGSMHADFQHASHVGWLFMVGCSCAVVLLSLAAPRSRPRTRPAMPRLRAVPEHAPVRSALENANGHLVRGGEAASAGLADVQEQPPPLRVFSETLDAQHGRNAPSASRAAAAPRGSPR
jgi:EmrB/QacA subfamily drug resistance transporter